jgi:hypothetical protein
MITFLTFACGVALGFLGAYAHMIWRRRKPILELLKKADALESARQTLRNILRVPKIEHAHKLASRTLNEIESQRS